MAYNNKLPVLLASNAESQLSNATEENLVHQYDVGNQNFWRATGGEQTLGNAQDALQFGNEASSTGQVAMKDATQIQKQKGSILGNIVGLGGKLLGGALTGGASFLSGGLGNMSSDSSFGENAGNFISGGFGNLFGSGTGTPGRRSSRS